MSNDPLTAVQNAVKAYMNAEIKKYVNASKQAYVATNAAKNVPSEAKMNQAANSQMIAAEAAQSAQTAITTANQTGVSPTATQTRQVNGAVNTHAASMKNFAKLIANAQNNAALNAIGADPNFVALPNNKKTNFMKQMNAKRGLLSMPQGM